MSCMQMMKMQSAAALWTVSAMHKGIALQIYILLEKSTFALDDQSIIKI
jgi:hypothetical protein